MTLPGYAHGRILFAGDAAHMLPIFRVRGADTGFQHAHNLGWTLSTVARGQAGPALLASYSHERVAAAREIVAEAGKSTRFITPPTRGFRLLRDAVRSLSLTEPFVGPLFHWHTSRPHDYADSPQNALHDDNARFTSGPANGAPLPNVRLGDDGFLLDHFGPAFWLQHFGSDGQPVPGDLAAEAARWQARGVTVQVVAVRPAAQGTPGAQRMLNDAEGRIAARLGAPGPGTTLLVRPDQHLCARWLQPPPARQVAAAVRDL